METLEIMVYLLVAIILGSLILLFIAGWDVQNTYNGLKGLFGDKDNTRYEQISPENFPREVVGFWDACGLGTVAMNRTISVTGSGTLNKTALFSTIKQFNLCKSLQSTANACGGREDVNDFSLTAPTIITLSCNNATETLTIT